MKKVVVAVTEKTNVFNKKFTKSLLLTVKKCFDNGIDLTFDFLNEEHTEYMSKNLVCNRVLASEKIDGVVFLNPNLEWDSETLLSIIDHDEDIVSGVYPLANPNQESYTVSLAKDYSVDEKFIEATRLQSDACYISRKSLVEISNHVKFYGNKEFFFFFSPEIIDGIYTTAEDCFFKTAVNLGYKLYLNPKAAFINIGEIQYSGNFLKLISDKWVDETFTEENIIVGEVEK